MRKFGLFSFLFISCLHFSIAAHTGLPSELCSVSLVSAFKESKQRVIAVDYDRTIRKHKAFERYSEPSLELLSLLARLAELPNTLIVINSARPKSTLENWFRSVPAVALAAENGYWYRPPHGEWKITKPDADTSFYEPARTFLREIQDYVWGSVLIEKTASLTFVHRDLDPRLGPKLARDLEHIMKYRNLRFRALYNRKAVEFLPIGVDKGTLLTDLLRTYSDPQETFVLVAGDDEADEDMFRAVHEWSSGAWTIQIKGEDSGTPSLPSVAAWTLPEVEAFLKLLSLLNN